MKTRFGSNPLLFVCVAALFALGCSSNDGDSSEAKTYFEQRCETCHGKKGAGNGPAAASLDPKPRNLADAAWQESTDDAVIRKIILEGGEAVGKSKLMPPNPDLEGKPEVVAGLVEIIRSFGQ